MRLFANITLVACVGMGCGTTDREPPDDPDQPGNPDQPGDPGDPQGPAPTIVTIQTRRPALVAFREETSTAWRPLDITGATSFEIAVTGPYRVAIACEADTSDAFVVVTQYAQTPADGLVIEHDCGASRDGSFVATGQMLQPGEVFLGGFGQGDSAAPWTFELPVAAGTDDLVMLFGDFARFDRIAIRRGVEITGDVDFGALDAEQEHAEALVPVSFTADNRDPDEVLSQDSWFNSGTTQAFLDFSPFSDPTWDTVLVPESLLRATDVQRVSLSASLETTVGDISRTVRRTIGRAVRIGDPTRVTLPERLGPVTFERTDDRLAATWSSVPEHASMSMWRESFSDDFSQIWVHEILLSPAFVAAVGTHNAVLDFSDVPGFKPAWRIDPRNLQTYGLQASSGSTAGELTSTDVTEQIQAAQPIDANRFGSRMQELRRRVDRAGIRHPSWHGVR